MSPEFHQNSNGFEIQQEVSSLLPESPSEGQHELLK